MDADHPGYGVLIARLSTIKRLAKLRAAIVMTACQPFTTKLISSNLPMFRYCWIWQKNTVTGHLQANIRPLNNYEDIAVFAHAAPRYFPQGVQYVSKVSRGGSSNVFRATKEIYTSRGTGYPRRTLTFDHDSNRQHPTQKPVALMEYLIRTYTLPGEVVLDFTMGSGTTGVAAKRASRGFVGIELDDTYFKLACKRIKAA